MICSMCAHGVSTKKMWPCVCGEHHCPHTWECDRCGTGRVDARQYLDTKAWVGEAYILVFLFRNTYRVVGKDALRVSHVTGLPTDSFNCVHLPSTSLKQRLEQLINANHDIAVAESNSHVRVWHNELHRWFGIDREWFEKFVAAYMGEIGVEATPPNAVASLRSDCWAHVAKNINLMTDKSGPECGREFWRSCNS
jgi:hypothetical protein